MYVVRASTLLNKAHWRKTQHQIESMTNDISSNQTCMECFSPTCTRSMTVATHTIDEWKCRTNVRAHTSAMDHVQLSTTQIHIYSNGSNTQGWNVRGAWLAGSTSNLALWHLDTSNLDTSNRGSANIPTLICKLIHFGYMETSICTLRSRDVLWYMETRICALRSGGASFNRPREHVACTNCFHNIRKHHTTPHEEYQQRNDSNHIPILGRWIMLDAPLGNWVGCTSWGGDWLDATLGGCGLYALLGGS